MEFLTEYGLFLAKAVTLVVAILVVATGIIGLSVRSRRVAHERIEVKDLNRKYRSLARTVQSAVLPKAELKHLAKQDKKAAKAGPEEGKKRVFVLDFHGNIPASAVTSLREEVSAVLMVARPEDEVLVRLESPGGIVPGYGLAASQLARLRDQGIPLTVAVDKVAASGGYMMACVADRILAAPFAVLGSIGVVAQLPNFHRALQQHNVDYELFLGGEYKRTVTVFGENTDKGRAKFQEEIDEAHDLFKAFVARYRPSLDMAQVATGEHWFGTRALDLKLVDELRTSDDYLLAAVDQANLYEVKYKPKKPLAKRLVQDVNEALQSRRESLLNGPWSVR